MAGDTRVVAAMDLGTTGCRASLWAEGGALLAEHYVELGLSETPAGGVEQDAEDWWRQSAHCLRRCVEQVGRTDSDVGVVALCASTQGHSWAPVGEAGRPLRAAFTWLDTRASDQAERVNDELGVERLGAICGKWAGPWHLLPQLLWLREHEPEVAAAASRYCMAQDFLLARLCGRGVTDPTMAAGSLMLDIRTAEWSAEIIDAYAVPASALPHVAPAGSAAGELSESAAAETGLPPGLPVVVGAQDQKCAALAAGLSEEIATVSLGTAAAITVLVAQPTYDPGANIPCFPYLTPETWVLEAPLTTAGASLRWLRDLLRLGERTVRFEELDQAAAESPPGASGAFFYPFLAGAGAPHWRPEAKGAFTGLRLANGIGDLARAVMEGVAFEVRTACEAMQAADFRHVRLFGGGARSRVWPQIIADVLGCVVELPEEAEMASLGAAMLAASAAICEGLPAARSALSRPCRSLEPDPARRAQYAELFAAYVERRGDHLSS